MKKSLHLAKKIYIFTKNRQISLKSATLIMVAVSLLTVIVVREYASRLEFSVAPVMKIVRKPKVEVRTEEWRFIPQNFSMDELKNRGCVADGILSGYGGDAKNSIALINRSKCVYLHRALETWAAPPDFELAKKNMQKIF